MKLWCPTCRESVKRPFNLAHADKFCDEGHPLAHSSAQRKPLVSGSGGLKAKARKPRPSMADFWAAVTDNGSAWCAMSFIEDHDCDCDYWPRGVADAHHYVAKRNLSAVAAQDPRNGVPLCRFHHGQVENARVVCPRPPYLDDFLADFGLADPDERMREAA